MTNEPAFPALPISRDFNGELLYQAKGLTIRDYFAAKALTSLLSDADMRETLDGDEIAMVSYLVAESMLKARDGKCKLKLEEEE